MPSLTAPHDNFICPITTDLMVDPVICVDGQTYDRPAIERWFETHDTSPLTGASLSSKNLIPNISLKQIISEYKEQLPDPEPSVPAPDPTPSAPPAPSASSVPSAFPEPSAPPAPQRTDTRSTEQEWTYRDYVDEYIIKYLRRTAYWRGDDGGDDEEEEEGDTHVGVLQADDDDEEEEEGETRVGVLQADDDNEEEEEGDTDVGVLQADDGYVRWFSLEPGHGVFTWADGSQYIGEHKDGKMHGHGVTTFASGNEYDGEHKDDKKHGHGRFRWADGNQYVGNWQDDKMHGRGVYLYNCGGKLRTKWSNGKPYTTRRKVISKFVKELGKL